jgi:hypothetical protein
MPRCRMSLMDRMNIVSISHAFITVLPRWQCRMLLMTWEILVGAKLFPQLGKKCVKIRVARNLRFIASLSLSVIIQLAHLKFLRSCEKVGDKD